MATRRNIMNVVRNYTEAEVRVREATSNDAWGPSSSLMSEIADLTYNVMAFSEIMSMIWKRVNDHGKNWRHVYKALTLLDYLIKTGSERVAQQCKENIFAIQTLKDFQFFDRDGKDQGLNVREKSKQLVALLKDDERLKTERSRAIKAKERFAQATTGIGSDRSVQYGHGSNTPKMNRTPEIQHSDVSKEIEQARPQTVGEEELQLQLALAMSKEEAEHEQKIDDGDELRLKMALSQSAPNRSDTAVKKSSNLLDLTVAAAQLNDPWGRTPTQAPTVAVAADPFGLPTPATNTNSAPGPWGTAPSPEKIQNPIQDIWGPPTTNGAVQHSTDPWGTSNQPISNSSSTDVWGMTATTNPVAKPAFDPFESLSARTPALQPTAVAPLSDFGSLSNRGNTFDLTSMNQALQPQTASPSEADRPKNMANAFLGDAANLVNLESLVAPASKKSNPFLSTGDSARGPSPTYQFPQATSQPSINQLRGSPSMKPTIGTTLQPTPMMPPMVTPSPYTMQSPVLGMPYGVGPVPMNPMMNYGMMNMGVSAPNGGMNIAPANMQPIGMQMQPTAQMQQDNTANPFLL